MPTTAVGLINFMFWDGFIKMSCCFQLIIEKDVGCICVFWGDEGRAIIVSFCSLVSQSGWETIPDRHRNQCVRVVGMGIWEEK